MSDADDKSSDTNDSKDEGSILDDGGIDTDERAGRSLGIDTQAEPDEDTKKEMEEEREKRLDPDNRPDGAEIDNTERTFDVDRGQFTDSEDYDDSEPPPFADPEDPNQNDDDSDDSESDDDSDDEDEDDSDEGDKDEESS